MAKGSNASPEVFGFDFQVNATIFLLLDNIKEVKAVRMEGASEDIELTMNDGSQIMEYFFMLDFLYGFAIEVIL